jgi:hypothetical protein
LIKWQPELLQARYILFEKIENAWDELNENANIPDVFLTEISNRSRALYAICGKLMHTVYPAMGMHAAESTTEANRIWRNYFTASQHKLLREL